MSDLPSFPRTTLDAVRFPCLCVRTHVPVIARTHVHHIVPLARDGKDTSRNRIALCPSTHDGTHVALDRFIRLDAITPRPRGVSPYAYELALEGYRRWKAGDLG